MSRYQHIAELLKARVENGDYSAEPLPGAQSLAVETACSYMTVRQALRKLLDDGVLTQLPNGRMAAAPKPSAKGVLKVAMVRPVWGITHWDNLVYSAAKANGCSFKLIYYNHIKDEAIYDSFDGDFDLIFMGAYSEDPLFLRKLEKNNARTVTFFQDLTSIGVRCLDGVHPKHIDDLIEYLAGLGHSRVDYLNVGPAFPVIRQRIAQWRASLSSRGIAGDLRQFPCESFQPAGPASKKGLDELLDSVGGVLPASAILCSNAEMAVGAMRSLHEKGLRIPGDVSVCCFGDALSASLSIPSLTTFSALDHSPEVAALFDFYLGRGGDPARLMYRTSTGRLIEGESTGPCGTEKGA